METSGGTSMGDLFNQRRATRKAGQPSERQPPPSSSSNKPRSFLDIQAEQERSSRSSANSPSNPRPRANRRGSERSNLPVEQGAIAAIKDSFGFIHCADRDDRVFFHFSEVRGCHPADLQVDDEVEFGIGVARKDSDKLAAYNVKKLANGTIEWEYEDEPGERFQGLVERPPRGDSRSIQEGMIRMLLAPSSNEGHDENAERKVAPEETMQVSADACSGPLVRFEESDFALSVTGRACDDEGDRRSFRRLDSMSSASSRGGGSRLGRNDLVEFTMVTERRTGNQLARNVTLIQSERERQRAEKEQKLMENASLEQGIVTTLKNEYGFLRSNKRREEVYFHYSNVVLPDAADEQHDKDLTLKEGQEMEFLVVTEPGMGGRSDRSSAREVQFLSSGSVVFHKVLAEGITGVIMQAPHPADSGYTTDMVGSVHLLTPVEFEDEHGETIVVKNALLYAADAPGGSFAKNSDGSAVGMWVRQGDTVLFDLVQETIDGSYRVSPTKHTCPASDRSSADDSNDSQSEGRSTAKAVRLVSISLAGRAEGVIRAVKDGYGFIHCTERPVDAYFRLYELLPHELQHDLIGNTDKLELRVGTEVQFDLSIKGTIATGSRSRKGSGERENLKAQRILLLPTGTIIEKKVIARGVKGIVTREDAKQAYSGLIELEETLSSMTLEERHPLVAKLVRGVLETYNDPEVASHPVVFHDIQSLKDDDVVVEMVERLGEGKLAVSHIPVSAQPALPGRLVISNVECSIESTTKNEVDVAETSQHASPSTDEAGSHTEKADGQNSAPKKRKRKKKPTEEKLIKVVHFDKHCLVKELREGDELPPGKGDVVECDVVQSRSSGAVGLENVRVVERDVASLDDKRDAGLGVGVISEVVLARKFGFITVLDENSSKREMLFFQMANVVRNGTAENMASQGRPPQIRKGDEVKFEIASASNGKRSAVNVQVLPKGTLNINTKAAKNSCRGIILMEPSHSKMSNTPSRQPSGTSSSRPSTGSNNHGSRWQSVDRVDTSKHNKTPAKEEGRILLIDDPTNMFVFKQVPVRGQDEKESSGATEPMGAPASQTTWSGRGADESDDAAVKGKSDLQGGSADPDLTTAVGRHLPFKLGAVAIHGSGVSSEGNSSVGPHRGDIVSFLRAKSGKGVRDIRVETRGGATRLRGRLEGITVEREADMGTARFHASTEKEEAYAIELSEVVSCDTAVLKENESVEGILYNGKIYGVCRTCDLYLESKVGAGRGERPRLNLTVRKELKGLGGKIMAQSMMAKGPDGTTGFVNGWTKRISQHSTFDEEEPTVQAEESADEFTEQLPEPASEGATNSMDAQRDSVEPTLK